MPQTIAARRPVPLRPILLAALILLADTLFWTAAPGLSFPLFIVTLAAAAEQAFPGRRDPLGWTILVLCLLPSVDLVQHLSVAFALAGLATFCLRRLTRAGADLRTMLRHFPGFLAARTILDGMILAQDRSDLGQRSLRGLVLWIGPVLLSVIFLILFIAANPVLEATLDRLLSKPSLAFPNPARFFFWAMLALALWPLLRLSALADAATLPPPLPARPFLSAAVAIRCLALFNLVFALQTGLDLAYLSGGVSLPDGISYATYARRGAYPLLVAALLAGGFALLTQPHLHHGTIRTLLLFWIAQTVFLVLSSILRLDLYVDAYGLTRLRFAAFLWMGVTATGLGLMVWQIAARKPMDWMLVRAGAVALVTLYAASLTNVAGVIARHNLAQDRPPDIAYLCRLGDGAKPALAAWSRSRGRPPCDALHIPAPQDWREWGYRNHRLRNSLTEITGARP